MFSVTGWRAFCACAALVVMLVQIFLLEHVTVLSTVFYCGFLILMPAHNTRDSKGLTIFCLVAALLIAALNAALITARVSGM